MNSQTNRGFTLVELAIVIVIAGLLMGGVLRGQELVNGARVNALISQKSSMQTAFYGFIDRFKTLPGDMTPQQAIALGPKAAPASVAGDGDVLLADSPAFFNNLAQAGFIACAPCASSSIISIGATGTAATYIVPTGLTSANSPTNVYSQALGFVFSTGASNTAPFVGSNTAGSIAFLSATPEGGKPLLFTGGSISSLMLAEMDRKSDDGNPETGQLRYTDITAAQSITSPFVSSSISNHCVTATSPPAWTTNPAGMCQGVSIL